MADDLTPWGETYDECAAAVLADESAPKVLTIAAWMFKRGYDETKFRSLIDEAVALHEREVTDGC